MELNKMLPKDIIKYVKSITEEEAISLLDSNLSNDKFKLVFFNLSNETKMKLLDDNDLLSKIVEILKEGLKAKILKNFSDEFVVKLFTKINSEDIKYLSKSLDEERLIKITQKLEKISVDELLKESNPYKMEIYKKYKLNIKIKKVDEQLVIDNQYSLPYEFVSKLNDTRINKLIKMAKEGNPNSSDSVIFVTVIKMYSIFGYDNSFKILQNKFTYRTDASIKRVAADNFVDQRRQFRIDNQHLFYSYDLATKALNALKSENYEFFIPYCRDLTDTAIGNFINNLKVIYREFSETNDEDKLREIFEALFKTEITERERLLKEKYINNFYTHYRNIEKREKIHIEELYEILEDVDIKRFKLNEKGIIIIDKALNDFLLGNTKSDNDALLRLVINKDAFGLNDTLADVINDFSRISHIIYRNNNLSLKSILDIIDVCKAKSFSLMPNEEGMTLDVISKIMKSSKHCTEPKEEIFRRTRKLYVESKSKVGASIPLVSGMSKDSIKYSFIEFGNANAFTLGIDAGCCLKVGGKGEEFLEYLVKSPHALIVTLTLETGELYICPFIRNGNAIFGNGIDPMPKDESTSYKLLEALKEACETILLSSTLDETIEFATITDLHQEEFLRKQNLKEFKVNTYLPIKASFYSDYHKKDKITYIISSLVQNPEFNPYEPQKLFYEARKEPFVFDSSNNDKERIEQLINSINFTSIDYQNNLTDKQKNSMKRNYKSLNVEDYNYIIGSKDWFIAINDMEVISRILPYDKRARDEYFMAFQDIREKYSDTKRR